ncbi:MAG: ClpXP protease specificity-enhancing factor [Proteobacteria bacterium]|nr:ClpXP protease specificity-enhancing factor [Pseudomonadota bacterium]MDA1332215.1 ClpXP protease specificity-enhancing factor [Pseudomonadota bacterium]
MKALPSTWPYLIRAIYDWCCDTSQTPYLSVRVSEASNVPMEHAQDGEIVLNIGAGATRDLRIENEAITFSARFNAIPREIYVSIKDVKRIFSRESGQGLAFDLQDTSEQQSPNIVENELVDLVRISSKKRLRIVKKPISD